MKLKGVVATLFVALVGLSSGCITTHQCELRCSARTLKDSTRIKDSLVIRYHDSLIAVAAKEGPTVTTTKSPCDSVTGLLNTFDITETRNGITTHLKSDGKTISASCREDAYKLLLRNAIRSTEAWHNAFKQVVYKQPCDLPHLNRYERFCSWAFPVLIILILAFLYVKYKLRWLDKIMP